MKGIDTLIATAVLIIISITAIFLALNLSKPGTERTQEVLLMQEGKNTLSSIDNAVRTVLAEGEGSVRVLKFSIIGGNYKIDNQTDAVTFLMDSKTQIVSFGVSKEENGINITGGAGIIYLNLSYENFIDVKGYTEFGRGYHSLTIRNDGYNTTTQKQMIYISVIPPTPTTLIAFTNQYNQQQTNVLKGTSSSNPNNLNDLGINNYNIIEGLESGGQYNYFQFITENITGFNTTSADYTNSLDNQNYNVTSTIGQSGSITVDQFNQDDSSYIVRGVVTGGTPANLNDLGINTYDIKESSYSLIGDGILVYGEGTVQTPRYRLWNSTSQSWSSEYSANSVGGTLEWVSVKASPTKDEYILATADASDDVNIQIYSDKPRTLCWHNGVTCGSVLEVTATSTATNAHKFDLAYEQFSGKAILLYSDNTATPKYRVWDGNSWSAQQSITVSRTTGTIEWVKLVSRSNSNEVALVYSDSSDSLNVMIWDGTSWGCEPSSSLSTNLHYLDYKKFDASYEQLSGDLFIAHSINNTGDLRYTTKAADSCTYSTGTQTSFNEIGMIISVSSQFGSDYVLVSESDGGQDDLHASVWNGNSWLAFGAADTTIYASNAVPNQLHDVGWAGTSPYGVLVYSDAATNTVVDYYLYNKTSNSWITATDFTPTPLLTDEDNNILATSFLDQNKTMVIIKDEAADLWAKVFDINTLSWTNTEGGTALETTVSSLEFPSFDFTFKPSNYNVEILHNSSSISYSGTLNSINTTINFTTTETDTYSLQIYDWQNLQWISTGCNSGSIIANTPTKWWCNITINPINYISPENTVRIRINSTADRDQGTLKEDYVQYYVSYASTSTYANISIEHNSSAISENPSSITKINVTTLLKTNVSSGIPFRLYIYNFSSNSWYQCSQATINMAYYKMECFFSNNPSYYISNGIIRVRLNSSGDTTTHQMMEDYLVYQITTLANYRAEVEHNTTVSYSGTLDNITISLNFSTNVTSDFNYLVYDFNSNSWDSTPCNGGTVTANNWYIWWCNITTNSENYILIGPGIISVRLNGTSHQNLAEIKEDYVQYYVTYTA